MSKQVVRPVNDSTGKSRQTVQSYQPVWMSHWMRTSSNATAERRDAGACGDKDLDLVSKDDHIMMEASRSAKDPRKVEGDTESCRMSSKGLVNGRMYSAKLEHGQDPDEFYSRRPIIDMNLGCGEAINCKGGIQLSSGVLGANENASREYRFISEGTSKKPLECVKSNFSAKERSSSVSMPSKERFIGPSTHLVPFHDLERYKFDKGKTVPPISRPSIVSSNQGTKLKITGQEHHQKHFQSADMIWDDHHESKSGQDWLQTVQKCSSLLPSQCIAPEKNEEKVSRYDRYSLQKFPSGVHETMRICTTVDSVEATPGGCPWFSQTTHSLLITKRNDVNLSKESETYRSLITQMNGNSSSDLKNISPFTAQANRGVKLQPISSSNSEGQGNVGDIGIGTFKVASKNESSAETDTMFMDIQKEDRPNSGVNSTNSTKVFSFDNNLSPWSDVASSREVGRRLLPDINLELPALPAVESSSEDVPTSSRTQSLDMNMLLFQAEQHEPKSNLYLDDSAKADPAATWVKRLKSSSDSSAQGTKSLNLAEHFSHEKKRVFFRSILKKGIGSSGPTPKEHHGKEALLSDGSGNSSKGGEHFPPDLPKKSKELLLSHVWIKRWLSNGSQMSQKKPETQVVCEPQSLNSSLDDLQKKQFPSIAAIALMGKSMTGFQMCELQKRGSFTVWKTKAF